MPSHAWDALFPPTLVQRSTSDSEPFPEPSSHPARKPGSSNHDSPPRERSTHSIPSTSLDPIADAPSPARGPYGREPASRRETPGHRHSPSYSPSDVAGSRDRDSPSGSTHLESEVRTPSSTDDSLRTPRSAGRSTPHSPFGRHWISSPDSRRTTGLTPGSSASDHSSAGHSRLMERPFVLKCKRENCQSSCTCDGKGMVRCNAWKHVESETMTWICGKYGSCSCSD